ncbi:MAG: hypothetical protein CM1200mP20_12590 [Pseudomonadota bacterium]|nr:MAG: hypothetical protein CM1200mP20_12590 [Pseudomonadota bacterium]
MPLLRGLEVERFVEVGERIWKWNASTNCGGFTGADDTLPERLLKDAAKSGSAEGSVNRLDEMLPEYYQLRGGMRPVCPRGRP